MPLDKELKNTYRIDSNANKLSYVFSQHMDYLNEPNSRMKIGKIRNELERTIHKIKRKRSDKTILILFNIISALIITSLLFNLNNSIEIYILSSSILFLSMGLVVFNKMLLPIHKDLKYLNSKVEFLKVKMNDVSQSLRQENGSSDENEHKKRRHNRSVPDF